MSDWFRNPPKGVAGGHRLPSTPPVPTGTTATGGTWTNATMPTSLPQRKQGVSGQVVMHHFARSEVRLLDQQSEALYQQVCARLATRPEFANFSIEAIQYLVQKASYRLQSSDLTINFDATKWFSTPNDSTSYLQMYSRGATVGTDESGNRELRLPPDKSGTMNPTKPRDAADTRVTFGANIASPDRSGIARFMTTGGVVSKKDPDGKSYFKIMNGQFNPKSRQIFAALNYGRRPHGSSIAYGRSVLILNDNLKRNAIFYMGDTFDLDASHRLTFGTLAGVFLYARDDVLGDLIDSTFRDMILMDTDDPQRLLEAHIFEPVTFSHDVSAIIIDSSEANDTVRKNAEAFAIKNGIGTPRYMSVQGS